MLPFLKSAKDRVWSFLKNQFHFEALPFWIGASLTGLLAVGYSSAFRQAELLSRKIIQTYPYVGFLAAPVGFLLAWMIVHFFAPEAKGSGIPQVMASLELAPDKENALVRNLLAIRTIVVKMISSIICVVAGGAIGREGPTIHVAASVFYTVGERMRGVFPMLSRESLIVAGGAAGIAAAFNTPLGGIVYAIEELSGTHFKKVKTALIAAVIISGLVAQAFLGSYLYLGFPKVGTFYPKFIPWTMAIAIVGGLAGAAFGKILFYFAMKRARITDIRKLMIMSLGCGLLFSLLSLYSGYQALGSGREMILDVFFKPDHIADWRLVAARFLAPILTYLSGSAGGIFAPSLAAGASLGSWFASLLGSEYHNLLVLLGMIAFLTGVTRAPFTAFVLVLEMTDRHSVIFPMMISALTASIVSRFVDEESFYEKVKMMYFQRTTDSPENGSLT